MFLPSRQCLTKCRLSISENKCPEMDSVLSLAKIESAPFAEHIADSHGLKFEIKRSQMPHSNFDKERPSAWERFSDRSFP